MTTSRWIIGGPEFCRGFRQAWQGDEQDLLFPGTVVAARRMEDPEAQLVIDGSWRAAYAPNTMARERLLAWVWDSCVIRMAPGAQKVGMARLKEAGLVDKRAQFCTLDEGAIDIGIVGDEPRPGPPPPPTTADRPRG